MKVRAAILGSGNIGSDLLAKGLRSDWIEPAWMVGIEADSPGLARAAELGLRTTHEGVAGSIDQAERDEIRIAFDATSAAAHPRNAAALAPLGIRLVDLTPAAIGPFCVPIVNHDEQLDDGADNINMVTCGGQARHGASHTDFT